MDTVEYTVAHKQDLSPNTEDSSPELALVSQIKNKTMILKIQIIVCMLWGGGGGGGGRCMDIILDEEHLP